MLANDPISRVLYIDLTRRKFKIENRPELFEDGLGGAGPPSCLRFFGRPGSFYQMFLFPRA